METLTGSRRRRSSWLALCAALVSCGGGSAPEHGGAVDPIAPGAEAPARDDLAEVSGDWAVATVYLQLERWPEVRDAIRQSLAGEPPGMVREMLEASLVDALAMSGARHLAAAVRELRGVDPERPMVLRLAETEDDELGSVAEVAERGLEVAPEEAQRVRHVLAVPATDPDVLEPALRRAMEALCRRYGQPESDELRCGGWSVRFEAEARWVFVVFGSLDMPLRGTGDASGTQRWAMDRRWPASVYFRQSALRGAAVHLGIRSMLPAVAHASDYVEQMMAAGLSEVVAAHARTAPHRAELDEAALAVRSSPAALLFVGHLTPHATTALARPSGDQPPAPPRTERQFLEIRSALPLRAARDAVSPPFAVARDTPQSAMRSVFRCGPFCFFGALAQPLGAARLLDDLSATEAVAEHVLYVPFGSLGAGGLRAHLDIAQVARVEGGSDLRMIADLVPALHLDARVEGSAVAGAIAMEAQPFFEVPPLRAGETEPFPPDQLDCLERLEVATIATLQALRGVDPGSFPGLAREGRQEAEAPLECITEPALRSEAESYLAALDAITAMMAPEDPPTTQDLNP